MNDSASSMDFPPNTLMTAPAGIAICVIYNLRRGFFPIPLPIDRFLLTVNIESCRKLFIDLGHIN